MARILPSPPAWRLPLLFFASFCLDGLPATLGRLGPVVFWGSAEYPVFWRPLQSFSGRPLSWSYCLHCFRLKLRVLFPLRLLGLEPKICRTLRGPHALEMQMKVWRDFLLRALPLSQRTFITLARDFLVGQGAADIGHVGALGSPRTGIRDRLSDPYRNDISQCWDSRVA